MQQNVAECGRNRKQFCSPVLALMLLSKLHFNPNLLTTPTSTPHNYTTLQPSSPHPIPYPLIPTSQLLCLIHQLLHCHVHVDLLHNFKSCHYNSLPKTLMHMNDPLTEKISMFLASDNAFNSMLLVTRQLLLAEQCSFLCLLRDRYRTLLSKLYFQSHIYPMATIHKGG